jgi:hypothetical protein
MISAANKEEEQCFLKQIKKKGTVRIDNDFCGK